MLTVLGGLAEFERSLILTRTGEGRARRRWPEGFRFGRKPKLTAHQIAEARARREAGEALSDIGTDHSTSATAPFRGCEGWLQ
jgi:DNA invertase Pin-like site-specific DNA recombinase